MVYEAETNTILLLDWVNIGMRIREIREAHKKTREEISELLDLTPKHIEKVENGSRHFSMEKLGIFALNMNVSLDYLVFGRTKAEGINEREINEQIEEHATEILELLKKKKAK